jgi:hypothetical protein
MLKGGALEIAFEFEIWDLLGVWGLGFGISAAAAGISRRGLATNSTWLDYLSAGV